MAIMTDKHLLIALRIELGIEKQRDLADMANVDQATISNIERGKPVLRKTAYKVFYALNRRRVERKLSELRFEEIDWNLLE